MSRLRQCDFRRTGKEGRVSSRQHVLMINGLPETEEVLKAVFEPRGVEVSRIRGEPLPGPVNGTGPRLVVIDLDEEPTPHNGGDLWQGTPRVLIGSARISAENSNERFLAKPFHYRELIEAVERLLDSSRVEHR